MDARSRVYRLIKRGLLIFGIGAAYTIWCTVTGLAIPCIFHKVTGLFCPGCGVTKLCLALVRLDFETAFYANEMIFCLSPVWAVWLVTKLVRYIRDGSFTTSNRVDKLLIYGTLVFAFVFTVVRNIQGHL